MQLSFSIDVILGNTTSNGNKQQSEDTQLTEPDTPTKARFTCSTPKNEDCTSPRSHTIEWKPPSCKNSPSSCRTDFRVRMENEKKNLSDRSKYLLQSPPNAHVVPRKDKDEAQVICDEKYQSREDFMSKMHSMKLLQKRLFASRYLPYPSETLKNHRVHHHPHHYPYQLPYIHPGHSMHSPAITPGIFSPQYSCIQRIPKIINRQYETQQEDNVSKSQSMQSRTKKRILSSESCNDDSCSRKSDSLSIPDSDSSSSPGRSSNEGDFPKEKMHSDAETKNRSENCTSRNEEKEQAKSKRVGRRLFTGFQILELEKTFALKPYLNRMERAYISQKVNLTECQIKTWFQNRRTKEKRRGNGSEEEDVLKKGGFSIARYSNKPMRIPGYGIQLAPTYGPPDQHLQAAIVDYMRRRTSGDLMTASH